MKAILVLLVAIGSAAQAKVNVVTTTSDFASIVEHVGGEHVNVNSIAKGSEDPHFIDAKPSFIRLLNQADLLIEGGAELEVGWLPPLLNNARNRRILAGASGHLALARHVKLRDVPSQPVDRSQGDVHPGGNPHFWLDPENARLMAEATAEALSRIDPVHRADYAANLKQFTERLTRKLADWRAALAPFRGTKVVTYHKSFDYFLDRFGFELVSTLEPKPGLEPSAGHIRSLITRVKASGVKLVLAETFRAKRTPEHVARETGARVLFLPGSVGAVPQAGDYFSLLDHYVSQIVGALKAHP
jgi:zinc/manganese transport system substrate-binding protein